MDQVFPENGEEPPVLKPGTTIGVSVHFIDSTGILTIPNGRSSEQYFQRVEGHFREVEAKEPVSFPPKWTSEAERDLHLREIDDEVSGRGGKHSVFLTIARDPNASEAAKRTVAALLREARRQDPEEAYRDLRISDFLHLSGAGISDISPLADFTNLKTLYLYSNRITDLTPLSGLTNLESLRLENNRVQDIEPLRTLTRMKELNLSGNQVSDLTAIRGMTRLYRLRVSKNQITDLSGLEALTGLGDLDLSENNIQDLRPLATLTHLHTLNASRNRIKDVRPLASMRDHMRWLKLSQNQIVDPRSLAQMNGILHLDLSDNRITDASALLELVNHMDRRGRLDEEGRSKWDLHVGISGNPLKDDAPLKELRRRGIEVD